MTAWLVDHTPWGRVYMWNERTGFSLKLRELFVCRFVGHVEPPAEYEGTDEWACQRCFKYPLPERTT